MQVGTIIASRQFNFKCNQKRRATNNIGVLLANSGHNDEVLVTALDFNVTLSSHYGDIKLKKQLLYCPLSASLRYRDVIAFQLKWVNN